MGTIGAYLVIHSCSDPGRVIGYCGVGVAVLCGGEGTVHCMGKVPLSQAKTVCGVEYS